MECKFECDNLRDRIRAIVAVTHNDATDAIKEIEELQGEVMRYKVYCDNKDRRNIEMNDENMRLKKLVRTLSRNILAAHTGDFVQAQYSDNHGFCVCEGCQAALNAMSIE